MDYRFQANSKFALVAVNDAFTDLPDATFQLSDGTWIMPSMPTTDDLAIWKKWLGSIRLERLGRANLVLFVEEGSDCPAIRDDVHQRLSGDLGLLFYVLHLHAGIEISEDYGADSLGGSCVNRVPEIWQVGRMPRFYRSQGQNGAPITQDWLEDSLVLRAGAAEMKADKTQFRRVTYGLNILFKGLKEKTGQDRLHQFVRSLEALALPEIGKTRKQFAHRCQTFAREGDDTRNLLLEAFSMRSAAEHLNPWEETLQQCYPLDQREGMYWQRTRQIERLACHAYSRLLRDPCLRKHFQTDDTIAAFWKLQDSQRRELLGTSLDIARDSIDL